MKKNILVFVSFILLFTACSQKEQSLNDKDKIKQENSLILDKKLINNQNEVISLNMKTQESPKIVKNLNSQKKIKKETQKEDKNKVFMDFYSEWKNVKYKMGGTTKKGIDCSAFTQKMYKEKFGINIPRTTRTQVNVGIEVKRDELIPGDLVFFNTSKTDRHVGIYVGDGKFLHASIKGVKFTNIDKPFYKKNYWTSRRILD